MEAQDNIRKRVCKACDRCRLKKSKCDGASPCSRCKTDNAICVFGERKKSQDKVYPKGYVEMLEQQQAQLVSCARELYNMVLNGRPWPGAPLSDAHGGHPLTHDILEGLNLLHTSGDGNTNHDRFEDDPQALIERLQNRGAPYTHHPRRSGSPESQHSQASSSSSTSSNSDSPPTNSTPYESYTRNRAPPTPPMHSHSPFPKHAQIARGPRNPVVAAPIYYPDMGIMDDPHMAAWSPSIAMNDSLDFNNKQIYFDNSYDFNNFAPNPASTLLSNLEPDPLAMPTSIDPMEWSSNMDMEPAFETFVQYGSTVS